MENEVSAVSRIAVMLVAMAALIGIVWVTIVMGNDLKNNTYNEASIMVNDVGNAQMSSLSGSGETLMPKAAAYALINQSKSNVVKLEYTDNNGVLTTVTYGDNSWEATGGKPGYYLGIADILKDELQGKAKVTIEEYGDALYKVSIISVNY